MRLRTRTCTTLSVGGLALIAAFMLLLGSFSPSPRAEAANDGSLAGTYDIVASAGPTSILHCIAKIDHDMTSGGLTVYAVCYSDVESGDPNGEPGNILPCAPGNLHDDDADGRINDGCPAVGAAETACTGAVDNDSDGTVNDGCPAVGPPETALNEGPDGLAGPPPPPPYNSSAPAVGSGVVSGAADFTICSPDAGGSSAPNIISTVSIPGVKADIADGVLSGTLTLYDNQPDALCSTDGPPAGAGTGLPALLYRVADKVPTGQSGGTGGCDDSPLAGRSTACTDYDADGCSDQDELLNTGATACGDDPYNPYDSSIVDLDGTYYTLTTVAGEACSNEGSPTAPCPFGGGAPDPTPGYYIHCISSLNYIDSSNIHNRIYCYQDSPGSDVNPEAYPGCSGDGLPGASPPGRVSSTFYAGACSQTIWGGMGTMHTDLSGSLTGSTLTTTGCFRDLYGTNPLGNVYVSASQNAYTGVGTMNIYALQLPLCAGSPIVGGPEAGAACNGAIDDDADGRTNDGCPAVGPAETACVDALDNDSDTKVNDGCPTIGSSPIAAGLQVARQSSGFSRDSDGDGCTDAQELKDTTLRDPFNRWDGFDVNGDGYVDLANDILGVALKFGKRLGDPGYNENYDRGGPLPGGHLWNLSEPNGTISWDDIIYVATLYQSSCNSSVANDAGQTLSVLTLDGALSKAGSKASILAGERLRWTCYAASGASVTLRFHYTWGISDVSGTGTTSFTHNPAVQLQSVECRVNNVLKGTITINWVLLGSNSSGGQITISSTPAPVLSGDVKDAISNTSIGDATVSLEYNDLGTWRALNPIPANPGDQARMEPDINPQSTASTTGGYIWAVKPGEYRVQVSKLGCTSNTGGPVTIGSADADLNVGIVCGDADHDGLPTFFETTSAGGTRTDPFNPDSGGSTLDDGQEDCDNDSLTNLSLTNLVEVTVYHTDPCGSDSIDSDLDGCTNIEELGTNSELGGDRDSGNFWDFYDVWTVKVGNMLPLTNPNAWEREQTVSLFGDIFGVAFRFGMEGDPFATSPLTPPTDDTGYHPDFDRSAWPPDGAPWHVGGADGTIDLFNDIFGVAYQSGHNCAA